MTTAFIHFDPELDEDGREQVRHLNEQLESSGWMQLLQRMNADVQYISSPLSRSTETALHAVPDRHIIIDDHVRPQISPFGATLRRNFETPLLLGKATFESAQTKFQPHKDRLAFQMVSRNTYSAWRRFGYLSDEDPAIAHPTQESDEQLHQRVGKFLQLLRPKLVVKGMTADDWEEIHSGKPFQRPNTTGCPKVYVIYTHQSFIQGVMDYLNVDMYQNNDDRLQYCEVVPFLLQFSSFAAVHD